MVDSATVYRIRVRRGTDSIDVADVIGPLPQVVRGTVIGLSLRRRGEEAKRQWFRVALPDRRVTTWRLPPDVYSNFTDVSLAPDGQHVAYVADAANGEPQALVRRFPDGPVVVRGPQAAGCDCDVDLNHARWVTADSFEIAVVNHAAPGDAAPAWLLLVGTVRPVRQRTIGVDREPTWHESPDAQVPAERIGQAADSLLESLHARGWFNGAVVLGRGSDEVYARGFGPANVAAAVPFTPDTPADGGSIAKTLTAAAVFMLEDEGRLRLDDFVRKHIPEYPHAETRVRDLLTHASGLPEDYEFFDALIPADRVRTTVGFLDVLRERGVRPQFPPGTKFRYSSLGFDVAALVVERVSGQPWERFLRERVFMPRGMQNTFLRPARLSAWPGVRTLSYRRSGDTLVLHDVFDNEGFYGGSNLYLSARDLHRWSRSFYTRPVLSRAALARGNRAATISDPETRTSGRSALDLLSWYYHPTARRYHYPGSLQGFWGSVYRDEERGYSIVYLSNNSMPQWLRPLLTRALIDIMEGRRPAPISPSAYAELSAKDLATVAGRYVVDRVGVVTLETRAGRAFMRIGRGIEYPAFPVGDGQLYVPGLDVWIGFPRDGGSAASGGAQGGLRRISWLSIFDVSEGRREP